MSVLDFNFNFNAGAPPLAGSALRFRPRYNSDVESRLVDTSQPDQLVPPPVAGLPLIAGHAQNYPPFHEFWDADLHAYMYLDDFLAVIPRDATVNPPSWRTNYAAVARNNGNYIPPSEMNRQQLGDEVLPILELALEREDRFAEVIDQDDGDGAINYWLGMLKIDPARHPATNLMVHVGRRIGEHVSMCLKGDFRCPRPSQVCPAITPMIDPPVTPSFPAGHAVQSYLISYLLAYSLSDAQGHTNLPQHTLPPPNSSLATFIGQGTAPTGPLFDLAQRVSENRIVAGVHYPIDIKAGQLVATQIFKDIQNVASVWGAAGIRDGVRAEFPQYML
jgi:membrane-associated phospholipid phosphatase